MRASSPQSPKLVALVKDEAEYWLLFPARVAALSALTTNGLRG